MQIVYILYNLFCFVRAVKLFSARFYDDTGKQLMALVISRLNLHIEYLQNVEQS